MQSADKYEQGLQVWELGRDSSIELKSGKGVMASLFVT